MLLIERRIGHLLSVRFAVFVLVGATGVVVHFAVLTTLYSAISLSFTVSHAAATMIATTSNFALNNVLTYGDMRLSGWQWVKGLASYSLVCSLSAIGNVGIASYLFIQHRPWGPAALAGIAAGAVWNYVFTGLYTWNKR